MHYRHTGQPIKCLLGPLLIDWRMEKRVTCLWKYQAYWAEKKLNLDSKILGKKRMLLLYGFDEFHLHAYKNAKLYK